MSEYTKAINDISSSLGTGESSIGKLIFGYTLCCDKIDEKKFALRKHRVYEHRKKHGPFTIPNLLCVNPDCNTPVICRNYLCGPTECKEMFCSNYLCGPCRKTMQGRCFFCHRTNNRIKFDRVLMELKLFTSTCDLDNFDTTALYPSMTVHYVFPRLVLRDMPWNARSWKRIMECLRASRNNNRNHFESTVHFDVGPPDF